MMGEVLLSATHEFVERYRSDLNEQDPATLHSTAEAITAWQTSRLDPVSVIHGDYRLDNLLFHPGGPRVTAVDWQTAGIGPPLRDVAYFLGTSLDTDQREAHEEQLLSGYHAGLVDRGIFDYPAAACWDDYRLGQLQGPMITVIGCLYATGTRSATSDAMFVAMARRSCAAIRKLGSLELV
jgi:aminoglycoside phosphotransferase (APT) family kinase protein